MNAAEQAEHRVHVVQGECRVSDDPRVLLTTTLGSCISACLYDPEAAVGGMNHFLLPEGDGVTGASSLRYGAYAMELLVNALMRQGASRRRLRAKLFGGARLSEGLTDIGSRNARFATDFLRREGLHYEGGSLLGRHARRIQFWPATGRARQMELTRIPSALVQPLAAPQAPAGHGGLELF